MKTIGEHTMRTSWRAAVGVVAKLVDMKATIGVGIMAADIPWNGGGRSFIRLLKGHGASDVGVAMKDSD
jgi:hypothetical protein